MNVAQIMRQYQYPTTTSETKQQLPTVMSSSPLSQIAGLGGLLASGTQTPSGWLNQLGGFIGKQFGGSGSGYGEGFEDNATITMPGSTTPNVI
jgi:hypothetical protein